MTFCVENQLDTGRNPEIPVCGSRFLWCVSPIIKLHVPKLNIHAFYFYSIRDLGWYFATTCWSWFYLKVLDLLDTNNAWPSNKSLFFFQSKILVSNVVFCKYIYAWNLTSTMNIWSVQWIVIAWCLSPRVSIATVLITHPCISSGTWVE